MRILAQLSCAILVLVMVFSLGFGCQAIYPASFFLKGKIRELTAEIAKGEAGRAKVEQDIAHLRRMADRIEDRERVGNVSTICILLALLFPITYIVKSETRLRVLAERLAAEQARNAGGGPLPDAAPSLLG